MTKPLGLDSEPLEYDDEDLSDVTPPVKVWALPVKDHIYSMGVDSAEGLGHGDNSTIQVIDHGTGEQVAAFAERIPPDLLGVLAARLGIVYNGALVVPEANNHGIATIGAMRRAGYRSIFRRKQINRVFNRNTEEWGFKTTRTSKPLIITGLEEALRNDEMTLHDKETITELIGYVRDERGAMGGSPYDDRVMALALAHHGRSFMHLREPEQPLRDPYMTGAWWRGLLQQRDPQYGKMVVGSHARGRSRRSTWQP